MITMLLLTTAHAGTWGPLEVIERQFGVSSPPEAPVVAANSAGHALAVWNATGPIRFSERLAGGNWAPGRRLYAGAEGSGAVTGAIGSDETAAVAWVTVATEFDPADLVVSVRDPGAAWAPALRVADGTSVWQMDLGVAGDGTVLLVWADAAGIELATLSPGGAWTAPVLLSDAAVGAAFPDLAVNDAGDAVVAWQQGADVGTAYLPAGGAWELPTVIAAAGVWNAQVGIEADGDAGVGYLDGNLAAAAFRTAAGPWGPPVIVSDPAMLAYGTSFAMDDAGDALLAWQVLDAGLGKVYASQLPVGGAWTPARRLSTAAESAGLPRAAYSNDGAVLAVSWVDDTGLRARAAIGTPGVALTWTKSTLGSGSWGSIVPVAAGGGVVANAWATQQPANPNLARLQARANE